MRPQGGVVFREEQTFSQGKWWRYLFLPAMAATILGTIGIFLWGIVQQLLLGKPWGDRPMSDSALLVTGIGMSLFCLAMGWLLFSLKLVTELRRDGLYLRFVPFHRSFKRIPLEDAVSVEARTYSPVREYGGWGLKKCWKEKGMAYNVTGDRGVRIDFRDGSHVLIGSLKAEELAQSIQRIRS